MADHVEVTCSECGETLYTPVDEQFDDSPAEYCSRLCRMRADQ